ncbi:MAG: ATP-grasp domain-containing protein [Candidatus Methylomirabilia bacterium]
MGSRSGRSLTVGVTGLAAAANPAPGVAVARSLRAAREFRGRLVGLTFDLRFTGSYSSYFDAVHLTPAPASGEAAYLAALQRIARSEKIDVLIPTLDPEALLCASGRRSLARMRVRTLLPSDSAIRRRAKTTLPELAPQTGFNVPRTLVVTSRAALDTALRQLPLPFFLKGSFADAKLVMTADHAYLEFDRLSARWGLPLLAQERVAGDELDVAVLYGGDGRLVGAVPMRKLGITNEGKAWAGVTLDAPDVVTLSDRLMRALGWAGAAELEIIRDRTSGALYLLEVNPRFPAWVYLATAAETNLPWAAVRIAAGEHVAPLPPPPPGVLFARMVEDHFSPVDSVEALAGPDGARRLRS